MSRSAPVEVRTVDLGEVRLRTSVRGTGRPLLLVTGLGASLELAEPFERELVARGRQVVSFDAPGIGGSTPYRSPRRMPGLVRTVTRLLDALGLARVDVFGVSLGGVVAQQLARQAPDRVGGLVLAATAPGLGGLPGTPAALLRLATPRRHRDPEHYLRIAGDVYGGMARTDPRRLLRSSVDQLRAPSAIGYAGQLYAVAGWSSLPWLHALRQPTLVLAGDDDPIVPLVNGRILAWRIPDATLHVVRGGGHLFILERPAQIAELVTAFLDRETAGALRA
ncbi:poly(3-hydroxyalkanoate) depolymerase [Geodermatophilus sp. DSM 44513]|uniref:poly(3-hydroxyalkanoate) depolymerase n=1 Tax=Geodermatophilus sp. DSM 44513 TaxID=1528104 RepID=UPI0012865E96|nr:poly(3-hydroxyalkanoate) depolymerase [Geodermatophilus sp. DSM 44513]WNV73607.1 poly(3-hydroxyalkanoate) depolymerase [Geodermatophilus sp. DSM 44513]